MNTYHTEIKAITFISRLENYLRLLQENSDNDFRVNYPNTWANGNAPKFEVTEGKRFMKVIKFDPGSRSAFCFIERTTGDIYKAATWTAPAKGKRANIFDETLPLTSGSLYR